MAQTKTYNLGLTIKQPLPGAIGYFDVMDSDTYTKLSQHGHTGSGDGVQIGTNALAAGAVTVAKIADAQITLAKLDAAFTLPSDQISSELTTWVPVPTPNVGTITHSILEARYEPVGGWVNFQLSFSYEVTSGSPTFILVNPPVAAESHGGTTLFLARIGSANLGSWRITSGEISVSLLSGAALPSPGVIGVDGKFRPS